MSVHSESEYEYIGHTRSGKRYRVNDSSSSEEDSSDNTRQQIQNPRTPQKPVGTQSNPAGTPSSSSHTAHTTPPSGSNTANPNPPPRNRMGDDMKLPTFKGTGSEDPEQHWFLCEAIWTIKQVQDDNVKLVQLATTFRERALTWYMKYTTGHNRTLAEVRTAMIKEFKKPKSESQCIAELKDIKQLPTETVWDFDQRFKTLIDQVSFELAPQQHKEWFIAAMLPHIRLPLMQQKLNTQDEALEMAMKLEASPLAETSAGMSNLQNQLANLTLQLHEIKKGKEVEHELWCTKCKAQGHTKDNCPVFVDYIASGAPNPLMQN
jgi:hypothetical protein